MILKTKTLYRPAPASIAESKIIRGGGFAPTLTVAGGTIKLYTYSRNSRPYALNQMDIDTDGVEEGNWVIEGEFNYLAWETKTGTPVVSITQSVRLEEIGELS